MLKYWVHEVGLMRTRLSPLVAVLVGLSAVLSGCVSNDADTDSAAGLDADLTWNGHSKEATASTWLHNLSEPVEDVVTLVEQFRVPVVGEDGNEVELDTWVMRPEGDGPFPVVLRVTPYYAGGEPTSMGRTGDELIPRGYAVAVSSVRGTGQSGGCFTQGGPQEAKDTAAVVEYLAAQPWSNGNVGIIGGSYDGTTPQDVWIEAPPSLKTIVPFSGISDFYKYNFVNGVPISIQGLAFNTYYWWSVGLGGPLGIGVPQAIGYANDPTNTPGAFIGEVCEDQVEVQEGGASSTIDGNKDAYWQERDFVAEYWADGRDVERASVFYIHGLQDWNVKTHMMEGILDVYEDSGVPFKVWLGQWGHAWPQSSNPDVRCAINEETGRGASCRADWWNTTMVAWFDQFLKGVDTGIMDAPPVQVQDDDGVWHNEESWPPKDVMTHTYYFSEGGVLTSDGAGSGQASYDVGPAGLRMPETERLVFRSEALAQNLTVSGFPHFSAVVTPDNHRASLIFSLGEERSDGSVRWINHGALSLNHAEDLSAGATSVAGQAVQVDLDLFPQTDVLHEGNRIVVSFGPNTAGTPGPSLIPLNDPGTISIDLGTATLDLPVDHTLTPESPQPYEEPRDQERNCLVIVCF